MCSITGIISKNGPLPITAVHEMNGLIAGLHHRGPDAKGHIFCSDRILFGSTRLRITDARNPAADMPMTSQDGAVTIVFNGEIYNFRDLKKQLSGYPFRTNSDTEVLMAAYQEWGRDCLSKIEGMYAFAIFDAKRQDTFMAVDPTGQKTIYVYEDRDAWVFASEIDPLIANPYRSKSLNYAALGEYVAQRFILGGDTHIREITKLESGTWAHFDGARKTTGRHYTIPVNNRHGNDAKAAAQEIREAVERGCRETFNLEVPSGILLSGGIDSTAVLAEAFRHGMTNIKTYSVGFMPANALPGSGSTFNEFEHSSDMAKHYGTGHTQIVLSEDDYTTSLDRWTDIAGEPLGSQEAPCLTKLFERAQADGLKVVFSGSGPDEVFDGYSYGKALQDCPPEFLARDYLNRYHWAGQTQFNKLIPNEKIEETLREKFAHILAPYNESNGLQAVQLLHFHGRLGVYEFRQMDLISMRHSIEARSPLADARVIAAAFAFDPALKQFGGQEKGIYKHALRDTVPARIADRKKQGFPIPTEMWFSKAFEDRAGILFEPGSILTGGGFIDRDYLKSIWGSKDPASRNLFSRLYTAEKILQRQAPFMAGPSK